MKMTKQYKTVNQPLNAEGLLKLDLQTFSEPPAPTEPEGVTTGVVGSPTPPVEAPPTEPPAEPSKTFTQDDVNAIATKQARAAQEKMLKQLGIEDFDNAKEGMKKFHEWQESQKTEAEKQAEVLKEFETKTGTLSSENATLKAQLSALKAGVKAESADDVVALAERLVNDDTDIDAAIASVIEKYPHFSQATQEEPPAGESKPQFSSGQHQKQEVTEKDKWMEAFK